MPGFLEMVAYALASVVAGGAIGSLLIFVGVVGLPLWAGWSRNRYCEREQWRNPSRWH